MTGPSDRNDKVTSSTTILGTIWGHIRFGNEPSAQVDRGQGVFLWPKCWTHNDSTFSVDGYFVWPDRLVLGRSEQEGTRVGEAILQDPIKWLREVRNGCFNIVIHDHPKRRTLFLSDQFGLLPLYLLRRRDGLWFASDLESLRRISLNSLELDKVGLAELYWFGYQFDNRTAYRDVKLMPPGTVLSVCWLDGTETQQSWVSPVGEGSICRPPPGKEIPHEIVRLMTTACDRLYDPSITYGIKLSAGMDSRLIAGCWQDKPMYSYTWGDAGSAEMKIGESLASALRFTHRSIPVSGNFFTDIYPSMFARFGIIDFLHELATPYMLADGCKIIFDGLVGDVFTSGYTPYRDSKIDDARYALGVRRRERPRPSSNSETAEIVFRALRVGDEDFPILGRDAKEEILSCQDAILNDIFRQISTNQTDDNSLDSLLSQVKLVTRSRRYTALQGTTSRPAIQTCYPFIDVDLMDYLGRIPTDLKANKKLYLMIYSQLLPGIRFVPTLMSVLPFNLPLQMHYPGRVARQLREVASYHIMRITRGRIRPPTMEAFQWGKWLATNAEFREGIIEFLSDSKVADMAAARRVLSSVAQFRHAIVGTRLMLTASYCAWHRT